MFQQKIKINIPGWLLNVAIIFFIICLLLILTYSIFEKVYSNKIYPGVWIGEINLKGKTAEQAKNIINKQINDISRLGIVFYRQKKQIAITPTISSADGSFAYQIISFDAEKNINQAYNFGRDNTFFSNLKNKINALIYKHTIDLSFSINKKEIKNILMENFSIFETPAKDAELALNRQNNNFTPLNKAAGEINGNELATIEGLKPPANDANLTEFIVNEEKLGKTINYEKAINLLKIKLSKLKNDPIQLCAKTAYPRIYKKDCLNIKIKAEQVLALAPLTLAYSQNQWIIKKEQLFEWLKLKINPISPSQEAGQNKIIIGLNKNIVEQFLQDNIASTTDRKPVNAKFKIKNGRVVKFQGSKNGFELNINVSFNNIEREILKNRQNKINLTKTELKSAVLTSNINNFGISEIIGIGKSNFSGSPKNRVRNIKNGAKALNGLLIKPDEEFSLNSALGEINAETGYLPELVIKGNETIPEYGGGLCQIGTTIFRVALAAGLPITQRRNHSYRVSYYEPAGTDATIYSPWPDMRFINDTNNHILIQTRVEGNNLYFDFWGADDGRVVEKTDPTIYNITKPGPAKIIETLDLKPGEKKCTETAHNGADAYFDYKITYADGEIKEKRFNSHYVPWQAVCLIGVEELPAGVASSTNEKITEE